MRRAMPYPCCGPTVCSVFRTIKATVPCQTSALSPMCFTYCFSIGITRYLLEYKRAIRHDSRRHAEGLLVGFGNFGRLYAGGSAMNVKLAVLVSGLAASVMPL